METDDEVAIVTTMLRKILLSVGDLAETVRDIKEEVKSLKRETELAQELEAKVKKKENEDALPETVSRPTQGKITQNAARQNKKSNN